MVPYSMGEPSMGEPGAGPPPAPGSPGLWPPGWTRALPDAMGCGVARTKFQSDSGSTPSSFSSHQFLDPAGQPPEDTHEEDAQQEGEIDPRRGRAPRHVHGVARDRHELEGRE